MYAGNNPLVMVDPDGEFVWFIAGGAILGGITGGIWANHTNGVGIWEGAITGAFLGAGAGALAASAAGFAPVLTEAGSGIHAWGATTSIINGANINMASSSILGGAHASELWKHG